MRESRVDRVDAKLIPLNFFAKVLDFIQPRVGDSEDFILDYRGD